MQHYFLFFTSRIRLWKTGQNDKGYLGSYFKQPYIVSRLKGAYLRYQMGQAKGAMSQSTEWIHLGDSLILAFGSVYHGLVCLKNLAWFAGKWGESHFQHGRI